MDTNMWFGEEVSRIASERNALRDEVAELKRKLAEVEGERDALRKEIGKFKRLLHGHYADKDENISQLKLLYKALENIANNGHAFDGATNADLAKRALKLYEDRSKINVAEILLQWNDANCNSPEPQEKAQ